MRLFLTSVALLAVSPAVDAKCAYQGLSAVVLAGSEDVGIAKDGGIVVGTVSSDKGSLDKGDEAVKPTWKLRVRRALVPPTIESLAPGLAVYKGGKDATAFELEDDKHIVVGKAHVSATAGPALAAPKIKKVNVVGEGGKHAFVRVVAEIDGVVPDGAIAIVAADPDGKPRSWGSVTKESKLDVFVGERCQALPNGTRQTNAGDKITLFWVDTSGRKSPLSTPIVVVGGVVDPR